MHTPRTIYYFYYLLFKWGQLEASIGLLYSYILEQCVRKTE